MPTGIWSSRLRSGSAHCDLEAAVGVRQCPLRSATRGEEEAAGEEAEQAEVEAEEEENNSDKI